MKRWLSLWRYGYLGKIQWNTLPENEDFCNHLKTDYITDSDYAHAKRVCINFEIKNLGEYHDLYVQRDTLLLADVFENYRNM